MKHRLWIVCCGLLLTALFVLLLVVFTLREGQVAVLTTFGRPVHTFTDPGLYLRWPWPVQQVYRFDARIHTLEGPFEQTLTRDGKSVIATMMAGWSIADPVRFLERVGTHEEAERNLNGLIGNSKNAAIGRRNFSQLVNIDPEQLQFTEIEEQTLAALQPDAAERYGLQVHWVAIRKLSLPEAITEKVFERMRAEREQIAERYRSEGEGEAIRIRGQADSERDQILARAEAEAKGIRAAGDAEAVAYYKVFEEDPELAMFLRKLEILEEVLSEKSTVVLGTDTVPFDLLRGGNERPFSAGEAAP